MNFTSTCVLAAVLLQVAGCSHSKNDLETALPHLHEVTETSDDPSVETAYVVQVTDDGRHRRYATVFIELSSAGVVARGRVAGAWGGTPKSGADDLIEDLEASFERFALGDTNLEHPLRPPVCTILKASDGTARWVVRRGNEIPEVCLKAVSSIGWQPTR